MWYNIYCKDMPIIQVSGFKCERCDHIWCPKTINQENPKKIELPIICPACKSPYWNKLRQRKKKSTYK